MGMARQSTSRRLLPLEDFNWLIEIFATMTDNTDTYDFDIFHKKNN